MYVLGKYCKNWVLMTHPTKQQRLFHHPTLLSILQTMECTRTCTSPKTCKCTTRRWKRPEAPSPGRSHSTSQLQVKNKISTTRSKCSWYLCRAVILLTGRLDTRYISLAYYRQ
ncbi:hypothetical protein GGI42DRAFT_325535 [Trichoderma sp. SZMC 28013]